MFCISVTVCIYVCICASTHNIICDDNHACECMFSAIIFSVCVLMKGVTVQQ